MRDANQDGYSIHKPYPATVPVSIEHLLSASDFPLTRVNSRWLQTKREAIEAATVPFEAVAELVPSWWNMSPKCACCGCGPSPVPLETRGRRRRREGGKGGGVCSSLSLSETALVSVVQPDRRIGAPRPCDRKGGLDSYSTRELRCGGDAFLFTETERWAQNEWDWGEEEMPTWNIALLQYSKWAKVHATLLTYHTVLPRALFQALATNKMRDRENEGGNTNKRTRDRGKGRWKGENRGRLKGRRRRGWSKGWKGDERWERWKGEWSRLSPFKCAGGRGISDTHVESPERQNICGRQRLPFFTPRYTSQTISEFERGRSHKKWGDAIRRQKKRRTHFAQSQGVIPVIVGKMCL